MATVRPILCRVALTIIKEANEIVKQVIRVCPVEVYVSPLELRNNLRSALNTQAMTVIKIRSAMKLKIPKQRKTTATQ